MKPVLFRLACAGAALAAAISLSLPAAAEPPGYAWHPQPIAAHETLAARFPPPPGFTRRPASGDSFATWLRGLPLKQPGVPVLLHTGAPKWRQDVHAAVIDIDVGRHNLQQCADAAMRLRAEWLYATGHAAKVAFNDTGSGKPLAFTRWAAGDRPRPSGRALVWSRSAAPDATYASFRRYLDAVFTWAGSYSLEREMMSVPVSAMEPGDLFIKGGFPGHAVLVADVVENAATGERRFLLLQSYMPAQEMHVLKNPQAADGSPWYPLEFGAQLVTPEWVFARESLRRWR
jgi:hypothetical protein